MTQAAIDLAIKNWHAAEMRTSKLEVALEEVLRMPSVPAQAKAIIREALAGLITPSPTNETSGAK